MKTFLKRMVAVAAVSVVSAFSVNTASAGGDVYAAPVEKPTIWKGFYAGGHIGLANAQTDFSLANVQIVSFEDDGFAGGLHIGYNWQRGKVVYGIEADYTWTGVEYEIPGLTPIAELNGLGSVRGRVGYAIDDLLLFATAGVAFKDVDTFDFVNLDDAGYVIGAGAELKVGQKYSLRLEALHYAFEDDDLSGGAFFAPIGADSDITVVRTGLSIHF